MPGMSIGATRETKDNKHNRKQSEMMNTIDLTQDTHDATIHTCPRLKGGTHGYHARTVLDAQRGGRPLQGVRRNCQEVYQTEETASGSIWRSIAYPRFRLAGVHQEAECQSIRINSFILSV